MSANDILDVLNIQRDAGQPAKKKQKTEPPSSRQSGMARELYNLIGPNTPPLSLSMQGGSIKDKISFKPSPWTKMPFRANQKNNENSPNLYHWVKGSKSLLEQEESKAYAFDKFNIELDIPELVDEDIFNTFMEEINAAEKRLLQEKKARATIAREIKEKEAKASGEKVADKEGSKEDDGKNNEESGKSNEEVKDNEKKSEKENEKKSNEEDNKKQEEAEKEGKDPKETSEEEPIDQWTYEETKELFELCKVFELKWHAIHDRFSRSDRPLEALKQQFYRICARIFEAQPNRNPNLVESLQSFSKTRELERKKYLESLLKRTPAEIAEEESLVIEARRFELAAKKMLMERSHLLALLDSPQTSQSVLQYQSSQGLANLYNNLMILDKHQKKHQLQHPHKSSGGNHDPVPPPIPIAASSSFKKDRAFQTHLQQYLSGLLKQQQSSNIKQGPNAIQQLLSKRLTVKEEEAYGLYYHANEKLTPGVILRSSQKLPGLQQRQSVLKSVNALLQELDIPTAGGTSWKPLMPTRKTMAKYDELLRSVVALLEVKKGKDKLEAEVKLIKSQRGLQ